MNKRYSIPFLLGLLIYLSHFIPGSVVLPLVILLVINIQLD